MPKLLLPVVLLATAVASAQDPVAQPQQPMPVGRGQHESAPQPMPVGVGRADPVPPPMPLAEWDRAGAPRHPRFVGELAIGGGRLEHHTRGSTLDDDTSAAYVRLQFEAYADRGFGGGIRIEGVGSDDDMFESAGFPASEASSGEVFVYFAYRPPQLQSELPLRVGLLLHDYGLEENTTEDRIDFASVGIRLEAMPEVVLHESDNLRWSIYGGGSIAVGRTRIDTDPDTFEADSDTTLYGVDIGTRLRFGRHANLGIGWVYRSQTVDRSEIVDGNFFFGIEQTFSGLLLSFGMTF